METNGLWISFVRDEQINGYYCQVYNDENYECEVDNFCIHDCTSLDDAKEIVKGITRH